MLLNDEAFFEAAQGLAARVLAEDLGDDHNRIRRAFQLCLVREPSPSETQALVDLLHAERADADKAGELFKTPALKHMPQMAAPADIVAWTSVARALLNLDEFITRE
jgi:hypothetical protein